MQRVILTTGGTGGHIFPALAVAEELKQLKPMHILFVGSNYGPERELATKAGLEFVGLPVQGFLGRGKHALTAGFNMLKALFMALTIMRRFKPDWVLGFGSYAAFAPIMAAQILGLKTAIHEQNSVPGLSNKIQGFFAKKIFLGMPNTLGFNEQKSILTGNPVRVAVANIANNEHNFIGKRLLVVGGSQGAKTLNDMIINNFNELNAKNIIVRHQCGKADFERVKAAYVKANQPLQGLSAFIEHMDEAYDWADLVLCRAGASTVAELAAAGRGAVFIPFPFATHDHQSHNAKLLVNQGAAQMFEEKNIINQNVMDKVINILQDNQQLEYMAKAARNLYMGNAAKNIIANLN